MKKRKMETEKAKIIFFGTAKSSERYRESLLSAGFEISSSNPDLGIIAYYGKILPKKTLDLPKKGTLNVHHSLLPRWRGPSPVQSAILAGDRKTGVTIHLATEKFDAGPILAQKEISIEPNDTYLSLEEKLITLGVSLLIETVPKWVKGGIIPEEQSENEATYSRLIKTGNGHVDWSCSGEEIFRKIRALNPEPGTFTFWNNKRLLILEAKIETIKHNFKFGEVLPVRQAGTKDFKIACQDGFINPQKIKLEGKKETTPESFLNGHPEIIGAQLD